jgi:hypothetical protein
MRLANKVVAFRRGDSDFAYPTEQFDTGHVAPSLAELIGILGSVGETWSWLTQLCTEFDGTRPVDMLKSREIAAVIAAAHHQYDQL